MQDEKQVEEKTETQPSAQSVLVTMTEDEGAKIDELVTSGKVPDAIVQQLNQPGAKGEQALAEVLLGLRDANSEDLPSTPAARWIKSQKVQHQKTESIREVLKQTLTEKDQKRSRPPVMGSSTVGAEKGGGGQSSGPRYKTGMSLRAAAS